jgi:GDP-D-mannose 3',5'-epimerase
MKALVCGATGFIGGHLTHRLKSEGYWVRGVGTKAHSWSRYLVDDFRAADLRHPGNCSEMLRLHDSSFDEVYQLAADFGGVAYVESHPIECLSNNVIINLNMLKAAVDIGIGRYFFSSSVCIYRDMTIGDTALTEDDAYPAMPHNGYGWEKLYSEQLTLAYSRRFSMPARIARFNTCYGPFSCWSGGREKAPIAMCRNVAQAEDGGSIDIWGNGTAVRNYVYIDDLIGAVRIMMQSNETRPTNIGTDEYVNVNHLALMAIAISGKTLRLNHIPGVLGVESRNFSNARIKALGWKPIHDLRAGMEKTYQWIKGQVKC